MQGIERDEVAYRDHLRAQVRELRRLHPWLPEGMPAGWVDVVGRFARELTELVTLRDLGGSSPRVRCEAIGERDGLLDIQLRGARPGRIVATATLVRRARAASALKCCVCGAPGHLRTHRGVATTRCGRHHAQIAGEHG